MRSTVISLFGTLLLFTAGATLAQPQIVVFEHSEYRGQRVTFEGAAADLSRIRWNDKASSIQVVSGSWELCQDSNFRKCDLVVSPQTGQIRNLDQMGWNDRISSLRPLSAQVPNNPPPAAQNPENFRISGRGTLAVEGHRDHWFNNLTLRLLSDSTFTLRASTERSQTFSGTYRWRSRDQVELDVTEGPGRGTGTVFLKNDNLEAVEIVGRQYQANRLYMFSFINQDYAPWN